MSTQLSELANGDSSEFTCSHLRMRDIRSFEFERLGRVALLFQVLEFRNSETFSRASLAISRDHPRRREFLFRATFTPRRRPRQLCLARRSAYPDPCLSHAITIWRRPCGFTCFATTVTIRLTQRHCVRDVTGYVHHRISNPSADRSSLRRASTGVARPAPGRRASPLEILQRHSLARAFRR